MPVTSCDNSVMCMYLHLIHDLVHCTAVLESSSSGSLPTFYIPCTCLPSSFSSVFISFKQDLSSIFLCPYLLSVLLLMIMIQFWPHTHASTSLVQCSLYCICLPNEAHLRAVDFYTPLCRYCVFQECNSVYQPLYTGRCSCTYKWSLLSSWYSVSATSWKEKEKWWGLTEVWGPKQLNCLLLVKINTNKQTKNLIFFWRKFFSRVKICILCLEQKYTVVWVPSKTF